MNNQFFPELIEEFTLCCDDLINIAASFRSDLETGLTEPEDSSLKMLHSYLTLPTGDEEGDYLALDFGGTNLRVLLIRLLGKGKYEVLKKVAKPLAVPGEYDFICQDAHADELFDFIADMVAEAVADEPEKEYLLGHTFSFPSKQTDIYNARLLVWTKEFATQGVVGEVVNDLLAAALARKNLSRVKPVAVINDTVAVLLAAAYKHKNIQIGSIYATGFNTCYYEPSIGPDGMIINLEAGGFNRLGINSIDNLLDQTSEAPFQQRLEKMVSGRYMGELLTLSLAKAWCVPVKTFTSVDISAILEDNSDDLAAVEKLLSTKVEGEFTLDDTSWVKALAETIAQRSARLVTASYVGILWHLYAHKELEIENIAVDGSVFEKMPHIQRHMKQALFELLGNNVNKVNLILENGGSALGAALAAARANR